MKFKTYILNLIITDYVSLNQTFSVNCHFLIITSSRDFISKLIFCSSNL